jgi:transposase
LDSVAGLNDQAVATKNGVNRNTVVRCITKCLQFGLEAALNDLQRPGKPRQLTDDARAWIVQLACQKPKDLVPIKRESDQIGQNILNQGAAASAS